MPVKRLIPPKKNGALAIGLVIGTSSIGWGIVRKDGWEESGRMDFVAAGLTGHDFASMFGECLDRVPADFAQGVAVTRGLAVMVADRWLAHAVVPWSDALLDTSGVAAYARGQFLGAGFPDDPDQVVRIDAAPYGRPRLAIGYGSAVLSVLEAFAKRLGVPLFSVMPMSVSGWEFASRRAARPVQALGVVMDADVALVGNDERGVAARYPSSHHLRPRTDAASGNADLAQLWDRLCLRQPQWAEVGEPAMLHLAGHGEADPQSCAPFKPLTKVGDQRISAGDVLAAQAGGTLHALDAVGKRAVGGAAHVTLLVLTVLAAAVSGWAALQSAQAATQAQARYEEMSAGPAAAPEVRLTREEVARIKGVNAAIRELNLPIEALLRSLQPPDTIQVAVLNVQTAAQSADGGSGLKIVAQALSSADMARYVAYVAGRKPFTDAYLTRHQEIRDAGETQYRFTVETRWKD